MFFSSLECQKIRVGLQLDRTCQSGRRAWTQSKKATIAPSRTCGHILRIRTLVDYDTTLSEYFFENLFNYFIFCENSTHFVITA